MRSKVTTSEVRYHITISDISKYKIIIIIKLLNILVVDSKQMSDMEIENKTLGEIYQNWIVKIYADFSYSLIFKTPFWLKILFLMQNQNSVINYKFNNKIGIQMWILPKSNICKSYKVKIRSSPWVLAYYNWADLYEFGIYYFSPWHLTQLIRFRGSCRKSILPIPRRSIQFIHCVNRKNIYICRFNPS